MKGTRKLAWILLIVGGLNWLLVGLFGWDIGDKILGGMDSVLAKIVYILIGLSTILLLAAPKGGSNARPQGTAPEGPPMQK
jgi:uncharacterized membrane protein YuzA (DUF378 family)